jgi:hypothetical protein
MGQVFLAASPAGRMVAVKVIHRQFARDPKFIRRFRGEVDAAQRVSGMYTAPVVAAGIDEVPLWLATAFVPGPSLGEVMTIHGPLPVPALWRLAAGLAEALHVIHAAGLVHRDLKPANVLLAADGPRVIDFGIACAIGGTRLTATGSVVGTPSFMSPEQVEEQPIGPASDVFSFGSVLAFAASGTSPFSVGPSGSYASVMYRIVHGDPDLVRVAEGVRELIAACLAKDPARRPSPGQVATYCAAAAEQVGLPTTMFWPSGIARIIADQQAAFGEKLQAFQLNAAFPLNRPAYIGSPIAALSSGPDLGTPELAAPATGMAVSSEVTGSETWATAAAHGTAIPRADPGVACDESVSGFDPTRPNAARVYDYFLGGKNHFAADRETADTVLTTAPSTRITARENRAFLGRVVRYLAAEAGIRQFLDIGTGLPTSGNVHEVAQAIEPSARVVYADKDPMVLAHARALLTSAPEGRTAYVQADLRDPGAILSSPTVQEVLDFSQPVALVMVAVLHFIRDEFDPAAALATLLDALPSGSYLAASHVTGEHLPAAATTARGIYRSFGVPLQFRDCDEFAALAFTSLQLVPPGVVLVSEWRPESSALRPLAAEVNCYGGVGRKP